MRCHSCRAPANVEIRRSRTAYCARCYPGWFRGQVQDRIAHERMFRRDDRLLVAVSGGKDSLALWHALTRLGYRADGMYIRLGIADYSRRSQAKSEAFAAAHGLTLHQVDLEECPMARGAKLLAYKDMLNSLEEQQPGAKYGFLVGFLKQGRQSVPSGGFDQASDLKECVRCGQPTTGQLCAYCRMADRGRKKAAAKAAKY